MNIGVFQETMRRASANRLDDRLRRRDGLERTRWYKEHPCRHIDLSRPSDRHVCGCGISYPCGVYGECVVSNRKDLSLHTCVDCRHYQPRDEVTNATVTNATAIQWVVGVTTCPIIRANKVAGHRNTLPRTLASIVEAGWPAELITVFAEPESRVPAGEWRTVWRKKRQTPWWNLYHGMRQLHEERPDATQLWVEDDTWLSLGCREVLEARGLPADCGILRVFRMSGRGNPWRTSDSLCEPAQNGYQRVRKGTYLWGNNAVVLPPLAVSRLAALPKIDKGLSCSPDVKLGILVPKIGLREWCCNPSLAQTDWKQPSTAGHNVTKRMIADTFQNIVSAPTPCLEDFDEGREIRIHVVRPRDGWILQRIGESFGFPFSDRPDPAADANLYVNYEMFDRFGAKTRFDVGYFTHKKSGSFDRLAKALDWCIAMSWSTAKLLPSSKRDIVMPGLDPRYGPSRPVVVGVCSSRAKHKHLDWQERIAAVPGLELRFTGGDVPEEKMVDWYDAIDYLLVTSEVEGGPMPVLEALARRKPVIAPNVGWCWQYPVVRYTTLDELVKLLSRIARPTHTWPEAKRQVEAAVRRAVARKPASAEPTRYAQLYRLIARHKPKTILEVGTYDGRRAVKMVSEAFKYRPEVRYVGYDLFEDATAETDEREFNTRPRVSYASVVKRMECMRDNYPGFSYRLVRGDTRQTLAEGTEADFAFIDGGHSVETIASDLGRLLRSKVIVLDDFYVPDGPGGPCPDRSRFGCNRPLESLGDAVKWSVLPADDRLDVGGLVRMALIER